MSRSGVGKGAVGRAAGSFAAVWLLFGYTAPPVVAECGEARAIDECLVGEWRSDGTGAAEWMKRNMPPGISIPQSGGGTIVFDADGTYRSSRSGEATHATDAGGRVQARATATNETRGRWSYSDGQLHLCPDVQDMQGEMRIKGPDGDEHVIPMPKEAAPRQMTQAYTCADRELETQITIPGIADPMVVRYVRADS